MNTIQDEIDSCAGESAASIEFHAATDPVNVLPCCRVFFQRARTVCSTFPGTMAAFLPVLSPTLPQRFTGKALPKATKL